MLQKRYVAMSLLSCFCLFNIFTAEILYLESSLVALAQPTVRPGKIAAEDSFVEELKRDLEKFPKSQEKLFSCEGKEYESASDELLSLIRKVANHLDLDVDYFDEKTR